MINTWIPLPRSSSVCIALSWVKTCILLQRVEPDRAEGLDCKTCTCKSKWQSLERRWSIRDFLVGVSGQNCSPFVFINQHSNEYYCLFSSSSTSLGDRCSLMYEWSMLIVNRRWHGEDATRQILAFDRRETREKGNDKVEEKRKRSILQMLNNINRQKPNDWFTMMNEIAVNSLSLTSMEDKYIYLSFIEQGGERVHFIPCTEKRVHVNWILPVIAFWPARWLSNRNHVDAVVLLVDENRA